MRQCFRLLQTQSKRQLLEVAALPIQTIAYVQQIVAEAPVSGSVIRRRLASGVVAVGLGLGLVLVRRHMLLPLVPFLAHLCMTKSLHQHTTSLKIGGEITAVKRTGN